MAEKKFESRRQQHSNKHALCFQLETSNG